MREHIGPALFLLCLHPGAAQTVPDGWTSLKEAKNLCQIAVPPEWQALSENQGAAFFHDATTALVVVTSQPGQPFKPLTDAMLKMLAIPKEKVFENSAKRIFYQDRTSRSPSDPNAYTASVPGKDGTCSCHITFLPNVANDTAKKIVLTLGPASD
jgi:hypothetical protein